MKLTLVLRVGVKEERERAHRDCSQCSTLMVPPRPSGKVKVMTKMSIREQDGHDGAYSISSVHR